MQSHPCNVQPLIVLGTFCLRDPPPTLSPGTANLVKPSPYSCVGGYKYLYTGNLSRQVRRTC